MDDKVLAPKHSVFTFLRDLLKDEVARFAKAIVRQTDFEVKSHEMVYWHELPAGTYKIDVTVEISHEKGHKGTNIHKLKINYGDDALSSCGSYSMATKKHGSYLETF